MKFRPLWQIPLMLVGLPIYWAARAYADWFQENT